MYPRGPIPLFELHDGSGLSCPKARSHLFFIYTTAQLPKGAHWPHWVGSLHQQRHLGLHRSSGGSGAYAVSSCSSWYVLREYRSSRDPSRGTARAVLGCSSCSPPVAERELGEDPLADLLDGANVLLRLDRRSSRLPRKTARSLLGMTFRTRGILITIARSEPYMCSLKINLAKNMSGVVLGACEQRASEVRHTLGLPNERKATYWDF